MIIFTDSPAFTAALIPGADRSSPPAFIKGQGSGFFALDQELFPSSGILQAEYAAERFWEYGFVTKYAARSQYDLVLDLCRRDISLPACFFCLAGAGKNFHGQRNRAWAAEPGNIHLTVFFRPDLKIADFFTLFPCLAAVSVLEAIDSITGVPGLSQIKWVNDLILNNAKVAGFLAQSQVQDDVVKTAVLGIGVNVMTIPSVKPDPFTPAVTALVKHSPDSGPGLLRDFLSSMLERLQENYNQLLHGKGGRLLQIYQRRSLVLGKQVQVFSDPPAGEPAAVASGRVVKIGNKLELYLENEPAPVRFGRLIIKN